MNIQNNSKCIGYIDMSNYSITGSMVAAVAKGLAPSIPAAMTYGLKDYTWRPDLKALASLCSWSGSRRAARIRAYGSTTGVDYSFWRAVELAGMEAVTVPREPGRREKGVDVLLGIEADRYAENWLREGDELTLVSGDGDFLPLIHRVREKGIGVRLMFWSTAASALKAAASEWVCLDKLLPRLTLPTYTWPRTA